MFLEKNSLTGRKNKIIVGYDLGDRTSQISFFRMEEEEPQTASVVAGEEQYNFPTVLSKRREVNQWVYGREACRLADAGKGILVENLLTWAREGKEIEVGGENFDAIALLALFMKRSLALLGIPGVAEQIGTLMITVECLDHRTIEVLTQAVAMMQLKTEHIYFQSHMESFFCYMIQQPKELWQRQVLLCDYEMDRLGIYRMECNRNTTPMVAFIEDREYSQMKQEDQQLLQILEENCRERLLSSVYLIGAGFEGEWYQDSLRYLCRGRRVFRGNNLYSKGACYGAREKRLPETAAKQYVFLGNDKLKANIGMKVLRRGQASYYALLDAGTSWFEAQKQCEFILESGNSFSLLVTPLTGKENKEVEIILDNLPKRQERAARISMRISMKSEKEVLVVLQDKGFGEIYPATNKIWQEEFMI